MSSSGFLFGRALSVPSWATVELIDCKDLKTFNILVAHFIYHAILLVLGEKTPTLNKEGKSHEVQSYESLYEFD